MDSIVAAADALDMLLVVGVYHAWDQDKGRITVANARPWAKWLTSRYKNARNIIWAMYPHAKQASDSVVMATVEGIREGDGGRHLITIHPDPGPVSSSIMHSQPWLSFNTIQTWTSNFTIMIWWQRITPKCLPNLSLTVKHAMKVKIKQPV